MPLPEANFIPGGPITAGLRNANAVTAENLDNEIKRIKAQYASPLAEATIAHQNALTKGIPAQTALREAQAQSQNFKTQNPLVGQPGVLGQIAGALYLQQHPELSGNIGSSQNLADLTMQGARTGLTEKNALSDYYHKRTQAYNYSSLPVDQKSALLAHAAGMGIDPNEATQSFMNGKTIADLATENGFDPSDLPDPIYPATKTSITQIQRRQQAKNEINTLNPILTNAIAPYSRRIAGYSIPQIADAISGDNPDQQAKFLAARALMPEMASLRAKAMGANVGIETIREISNASMGHIKAFESLVDPDIYKKANEYVDTWIDKAVTAANKVGLQPGKANKEKISDQLRNSPEAQTEGLAQVNINQNVPEGDIQQMKVINGQEYVMMNGKVYKVKR